MHQSYLGTERNTVIPNWFQPCKCCYCLCYPGQYLRLRIIISYNWAQVLEVEACDSLKLLSIYFDLCVDPTGVVWHQLSLLGTDLHAVGCGGFVKMLNSWRTWPLWNKEKLLLSKIVQLVVSWYFEPSQPQSITSGLKTIFNLSPFFFFSPSMQVIKPQINHKKQIQSNTNAQKTYTNTKQKIDPFSTAPVKKAQRLGHTGIMDNSVNF